SRSGTKGRYVPPIEEMRLGSIVGHFSATNRQSMDIFIARQAIFDRQRKLYGYELLFRSELASNAFDGTEAAAATMQVLSNTLMSTGVEKLLGGQKAFVNFDHRLLL